MHQSIHGGLERDGQDEWVTVRDRERCRVPWHR